jgi:hypothetical protein
LARRLELRDPCKLVAGLVQADLHGKIARAPHTPLVRGIFESFLTTGCPKVRVPPRKDGGQGANPFGHGESSNPEKVLKYSVNAPQFRDP